jgi:hypothetical protein
MSETASLAPARGAAAFGALVGGAMAMGVSPIFVRWADVGPFASAFWRVALALPLLWLWMRFSERSLPRRRFSWPTLLAGLAFTGDLLFWHSAILHTSTTVVDNGICVDSGLAWPLPDDSVARSTNSSGNSNPAAVLVAGGRGGVSIPAR